jgi:hypothetical protein
VLDSERPKDKTFSQRVGELPGTWQVQKHREENPDGAGQQAVFAAATAAAHAAAAAAFEALAALLAASSCHSLAWCSEVARHFERGRGGASMG